MQPRVSLRNVSVHFPIYSKGNRSLKKNIVEFATGGLIKLTEGKRVVVEALQNLTLDFVEGDRVGILGHNGAGKSTFLRVVAGIYEPSMGEVTVRGRMSSLFDIGIGTEGDATGFENIRMRGLLFGMTPDEIAAKTEEIGEFSGLGEYLNMPLRTYSAGMMLRLAFSVATCMQPEILTMDEWIATGDKDFIDKASKRMNDLVGQSKVLLLASHNAELLKRVCNKAILLEHGRLVDFDNVDSVMKKYQG